MGQSKLARPLLKYFSLVLTLAHPLAKFKRKWDFPKWLRIFIIMLKHFILLFKATGILIYADFEMTFLI